jgi:hypothetical protein
MVATPHDTPHSNDNRVSEVRAVELLEDLCDAMSDYTLSRSSPAPAAAAADRAADSALDSSSSSSSEQQTAAARVWVKHRGEGSVRVPKDARCVCWLLEV